LCANWVPELGEEPEVRKDCGPVVRIDRLDPKRAPIKCSVCNGKTGCVQCSHGNCRAAIHPHCMMENPGGFSWRVVESSDREGTRYDRELYCARHMDDVGLPLKRGQLLIQVSLLRH
jgi:hypothetical protein